MSITYVLWYYTPSVIAAGAFAGIFAILTVVHLFQVIHQWRSARYCIPFIIGALFETIGYGARLVAHYNLQSTMLYAIQSLLILLGPILFAASIYMILGHIIREVDGEEHSMIKLRWLTKTFVLGDVLCFLIQGGGGGILSGAKSQSTVNLGNNVILSGLVLQIIIFCFFILVAAKFQRRGRRDDSFPAHIPWQRYLGILYTISLFIAMRNVYRAIEYALGNSGYLIKHEWALYVFDATLMVLVLSSCIYWYSCSFETGSSQDRLLSSSDIESSHGHRMELRAPKYKP